MDANSPPKAATVFPQPIALAASFDAGLAYRMGSAISTEARAMYNLQRKEDGTVRCQPSMPCQTVLPRHGQHCADSAPHSLYASCSNDKSDVDVESILSGAR